MNNSSHSHAQSWVIGKCDVDSTESKIDVILYITIATLALLENATIFIGYLRYRALRTITNTFLVSLTTSDIMVALFSIPFSFGVFVCALRPPQDKGNIGDLIYLICDMFPSILSIYSLSIVAIDRMVAIATPYSYATYMTSRRAWMLVVLTWMLVFMLVSLILVLERRPFTLVIVVMSYVVPVTLMVLSYTVIGYIAKRHARAIVQWEKTGARLQKESRAFSDSNTPKESTPLAGTGCEHKASNALASSNSDGYHSKKRSRVHLWREIKSAMRLLLLVTIFITAWTPFMGLNVKLYMCPNCDIDIRLVKYFKLLHYGNSALNPVLFVLLNRRWRSAFARIWRVWIRKTRRDSVTSQTNLSNLRDW